MLDVTERGGSAPELLTDFSGRGTLSLNADACPAPGRSVSYGSISFGGQSGPRTRRAPAPRGPARMTLRANRVQPAWPPAAPRGAVPTAHRLEPRTRSTSASPHRTRRDRVDAGCAERVARPQRPRRTGPPVTDRECRAVGARLKALRKSLETERSRAL